ncbi:hypothetical protein ACFOHK_02530 [Falsigemmobacter intermedius]|uniref:Oxidoreductase n=1 Tax=Falsigemmobacter intermedius TaxID=1553448 RepID=A0A444MDE2_9RHOB|nr:hypothetical protein [Falsigemmobacter intermedius]RWY42437.1 hypothetical protein EP867_06800 [Falsigemmobacter intermedius]
MWTDRSDIYLRSEERSPEERHLIQAWLGGQSCDFELVDNTPQVRIAAAILFELLQKDLPPRSRLHLSGAVIEGGLNLCPRTADVAISFTACCFQEPVFISGGGVGDLTLRGCKLPGLIGVSAQFDGDIQITETEIEGVLDLTSAKLSGSLKLSAVSIREPKGSTQIARHPDAPACGAILSNLQAGGGVHLNEVASCGPAQMPALVTGTNLTISSCCFQAPPDEFALCLDNVRVGDNLQLLGCRVPQGKVSLRNASAGCLTDDEAFWSQCAQGYIIDGLSYPHMPSECLRSVQYRIDWLTRGSTSGGSFASQPWRQFAHVLRENADDSAAREILMAREKLYISHEQESIRQRTLAEYCEAFRNANLVALTKALFGTGDYLLRWIWAFLKWSVIGFGYSPQRPFWISLVLVTLGTMLAGYGFEMGVFVPASDQILTSEDWLNAVAINPIAPTAVWSESPSALHYEEFSPFLFALDTYLPVMDLGQEKNWVVTTTTDEGDMGRHIWFAFQAAGWIVTSLGIAAVAGLVQKGRND